MMQDYEQSFEFGAPLFFFFDNMVHPWLVLDLGFHWFWVRIMGWRLEQSLNSMVGLFGYFVFRFNRVYFVGSL
jgi:hypothetical protein